MASRTYLRGLRVAVTVAFIFSLALLPPKSGNGESLEESKMGLGSKPPGCVNRCLNCWPCIATLVIPSHQMKEFSASSRGEDDSYYLLSWKCRCGNKLFQP